MSNPTMHFIVEIPVFFFNFKNSSKSTSSEMQFLEIWSCFINTTKLYFQ